MTLGDGQTFDGVTVTAGIDSAPLVDAADLGNPLCRADVGFPVGSTSGRMVLCERGGNARVEKSLAVQQGGGVAMLLFNPGLNTINTDNHYIPSLHVDEVAGAATRAYIQSRRRRRDRVDVRWSEGGCAAERGGRVLVARSEPPVR